jgi:hypothetical protein
MAVNEIKIYLLIFSKSWFTLALSMERSWLIYEFPPNELFEFEV